jgi:hypothetical protein
MIHGLGSEIEQLCALSNAEQKWIANDCEAKAEIVQRPRLGFAEAVILS